MHDRLYGALYPLAFGVIAFSLLGFPRTTRQSRAVSVFAVIGAVAGLRLVGFAGTAMGVKVPIALIVVYVLIAVAIALGGYVVWRGVALDLDEKIDFAQMAAPRPRSRSAPRRGSTSICRRSNGCAAAERPSHADRSPFGPRNAAFGAAMRRHCRLCPVEP